MAARMNKELAKSLYSPDALGALGAPPATEIAVSRPSDVAVALRAVKATASRMGFDATGVEELAIVASELATNLLKHAGEGTLKVSVMGDSDEIGIQIETVDYGPGIADVEEAIADGFSTSASLGCGLGAVNRLMDELKIISQRGPDHGTTVLCRRWLRGAAAPLSAACPLAFGAATRPCLGNERNGDAFVIKSWGGGALAGVIDGLGHGQFAHVAAQRARQYVETHYDRPLEEIFRGAGRACRATRGVVMALARFDFAPLSPSMASISFIPPTSSSIRLSFASVGNIETRVICKSGHFPFVVKRGIIGKSAPLPNVTRHPWDVGNMLILHSDGIRTHWQREDFFPALAGASAAETAHNLLRALAKDNDDATVVVVKGVAP